MLYRSESSNRKQSANSMSRTCWVLACILAELIFCGFLELTTQQWVSDLFNVDTSTVTLWSEYLTSGNLSILFPHYIPAENVTTASVGVTDWLCQTVVAEKGLELFNIGIGMKVKVVVKIFYNHQLICQACDVSRKQENPSRNSLSLNVLSLHGAGRCKHKKLRVFATVKKCGLNDFKTSVVQPRTNRDSGNAPTSPAKLENK